MKKPSIETVWYGFILAWIAMAVFICSTAIYYIRKVW